MKPKLLADLVVAADVAVGPGVALARGGGGGGFHGGAGFGRFHGGSSFHGGFGHHGFVSDPSFNLAPGFRHDHDLFFGRHVVFVNPGLGYYDPYNLEAYAYEYLYANDAAPDYSDVILAAQRALAQPGYFIAESVPYSKVRLSVSNCLQGLLIANAGVTNVAVDTLVTKYV